MRHTFIVPCFKPNNFLIDLIRSLKKQSENSNIVLISGEESSFLKEISQNYDLPLKINPDSGSIGKDWNFCIKQANTEFFTIAHQDDIYLKSFTKDSLNALDKTDALLSFTNYREIKNNKVIKKSLNLKIKDLLLTPFKIKPNNFTQKLALILGDPICCPSVTYRTKAFQDYLFNPFLNSNLDWLAWLDLTEQGEKFVFINKILVLHRLHEKSQTKQLINQDQRTDEDLFIFKEIYPEPIAKILAQIYKLSEKGNEI